MKKNYYEWLEINENASPEIIEKAYKTLVKKYHPDLQENSNKKEFEEIIKKINEAYSVLSDKIKKENYDISLEKTKINYEEYSALFNEKANLEKELNNLKNSTNVEYNSNIQNNQLKTQSNNSKNTIDENIYNSYQKEINNAVNKAYHDAYIKDLKDRGYKIKYKHSFKDFLAIILTIIVLIIIGVIAWNIPFTRNQLISFYNHNSAFKFIIDFITSFTNNLFNK